MDKHFSSDLASSYIGNLSVSLKLIRSFNFTREEYHVDLIISTSVSPRYRGHVAISACAYLI